jgi:hypothetical protein
LTQRVPCPPEPLPPPLMNSEEGTFAYNTIVVRLPAIARLAIAENDFPAAVVKELESLAAELPDGPIRLLRDDGGPDLAAWAGHLEPYLGSRWLDIPWYFSEAYFYRRILEATRYFSPGPTHNLDPFAAQKRAGLRAAREPLRPLSARLNAWVSQNSVWEPARFALLAYYGLWGNRMDLSLWPAGTEGHDLSHMEMQREKANILADDTPLVAQKVAALQGADIRFIIDNAGFELVCDLCLADYLLACGIAGTVTLHVKAHPTYVSDAMAKDVYDTIATLADDAEVQVRRLAARWQNHLRGGRLQMRADLFWTAPLAFWEMPAPLRRDLATAALVFIKGDANYRRLAGDRRWPFTTPLADVACYFPAPFVALRTLKSELALGLAPGQPEALTLEDPQWLTDGRYGVIQYVGPM